MFLFVLYVLVLKAYFSPHQGRRHLLERATHSSYRQSKVLFNHSDENCTVQARNINSLHYPSSDSHFSFLLGSILSSAVIVTGQ